MMEVKDRQTIQKEILQTFPGTDPEIDIDWDIAEISFKAGETQGKKAGIREVVDWMFSISTAQEVDLPPKLIAFTMLYSEWQAKLKEWGIE